ncbi:MAG: hypothetical protein R3A52_14990 [Polyangiales bacterium]
MSPRRWSLGVALALSALAPAARADDLPADARATRERGYAARARVDVAVTAGPSGEGVSSFAAATRLSGGYRFSGGFGLTAALGFVGNAVSAEGQADRGGVRFGNALLGVDRALWLAPAFNLRAGLRVGAPLAVFPGGIAENRLAELSFTQAAVALGYRDPFVWEPNAVPIVLDLEGAWRASRHLTVEARVAPALLVSVNQRPTRLALAAGADAVLTVGPFVGHAGLSYFLRTLALENEHLDQLSAGLGAGVSIGAQRILLDATVALDAPYGIAVSGPRPSWGVALVADLRFARR